MKRKVLARHVSRVVTGTVAAVLILIPFHAFLTVWISSGLGHYTALRLWKECVLLLAGVGALYLFAQSRQLRQAFWRDWLWRAVVVYGAVTLVWGVVAYIHGGVTAKAVMYGELLNLRPFAMLLIAWVAASHASWLYRHWQRLVLWPAAGVVAIGLLQYFVLPYDFMKHFGYSARTIWPYETIDHKTSYIRVRSTLRGANLLGGYLILVLSVLGSKLLVRKRQATILGAIIFSLLALFVSGSRGAWLGAIAAAAVLVWLGLSNRRARRWLVVGAAMVALVCSGLVVALRHNDYVQNVVFHTDEHSTSSVSSNSAHVAFTRNALKEIATEPLGRGPGSAGPAGVYNTGHPARIAENYFLQIGQETGWVGLLLLLAIFWLLAKRLWLRRSMMLAQVLLASFVGLNVMALLMHIWTDDTVAYLFFGLSGIALAQLPESKRAQAS